MARLDLAPSVDALRASLTAMAAAGTGETREAARLLAAGMGPAVRLVLLDALSAMAAEVTAAWDGGLVDVRLRAGEPEFVVVADPRRRPRHPRGRTTARAPSRGSACGCRRRSRPAPNAPPRRVARRRHRVGAHRLRRRPRPPDRTGR